MTWYERPRDPQEQHGFELIGAMGKRRRVSLGWTQRYLEGQSSIDQTVISRIENGKQYGLRWSRFANLVDSLGGFDVALAPWSVPGARLPIGREVGSPQRIARIDLVDGPDDLDDAV